MGQETLQQPWVNWNEVLSAVGDDVGSLRELATLFLDAMPRHMAAIREALQRDDWPTVAHESHAVKGQIAFFTKDEPYLAARLAVNTARAGEEDACRSACCRLALLLDQLISEILKQTEGS